MKNDNNYDQSTASQPQTETAELPKQPSLVPLFLEMRSEGMSLGKISQLIGIPKSTLFGWNTRYRDKIDELKRIQMEALEERILGSYQHQFTTVSRMLKRLEKVLARKLRDFEDDLSLTEVFWMASNLRHQVHRFRTYSAVTDVPPPRPTAAQIRTIPHENELPSPE